MTMNYGTGGGGMPVATGQPTWGELAQILQVLFSGGNTQQNNAWNYGLGQQQNQNTATRNANDFFLGQGANANTAQGNWLDFQAAMAGVGASTQNAGLDSQTRIRIAQIGAEQDGLDRNLEMLKFLIDDAWRKGESDKAYRMQEAAMQLEREKFGLQKEQQAYDNGMTTAQFQLQQEQFNRTFGLDVAKFNSSEANQAFQNQMQGAMFQQGQQQFDKQHALARSQFGLQQQQAGAQQALDFNRFGLEQQRFALDRDRQRAEMAANPYNAFANAQMVRGQAASPSYAAFGTPGSGWAYGYQDQPEMPMPRIQLPQMPQGFGQPNSAYPKVNAPTFNSSPMPPWIKFPTNVKAPGVV